MDTAVLPKHVIVTKRPSYERYEDDRGKIIIVKGKRIEFNRVIKEASAKVRGFVILAAEDIKRRHLGQIKATGYHSGISNLTSIIKVYFRRK